MINQNDDRAAGRGVWASERYRSFFLTKKLPPGVPCLVLLAALTSGCAAVRQVAPPEVPVEARTNKAVVYFYRSSSVFGVARTIDVYRGAELIGRLKSGSHFLHVFDPGEHVLTAKILLMSTVTLKLNPGRTYYVRASVDFGLADAKPNLAMVYEELGKGEIAKTKYAVPD